jgi:hypothetical protein
MKSAEWVDLTDEDRQAAFNSLPDMLDGFLKTWGWLHFAKAIEAQVRARNAHLVPPQKPVKPRRVKMVGKAAGGHARAAALSPERRREIAIKANAARWDAMQEQEGVKP